jgi:transcriptional regulator with XRE-family HTH domain
MQNSIKSSVSYRELVLFRVRRGWTLRQLSKMTGLSSATLWRLERGIIKATPRTVVKLQDALGLSLEQVESLLEGPQEVFAEQAN